MRTPYLICLFAYFLKRPVRTVLQHTLKLLKITFLRVGLIKNVILLIAQIGASEDKRAPDTVARKPRVATLLAGVGIKCSEAIPHCHAVVAQFRSRRARYIKAFFYLERVYDICRIFRIIQVETQIAIFEIGSVIGVVGIDEIFDIAARPRHGIHEFAELLKKRPREIIITAIIHGLPCIAPPIFFFIYFDGYARRHA